MTSSKKNTKQTLSIALATYNEENNIVDCLESIKNLADEIIVVDGNSTDRTAEIAKSAGAKVISTENNKMFHINKNIAIKSCKSEWILLLDADERVTDALKKAIKDLINSNPKENGFWINRKNWFLGGFLNKGGAYPDPVIRLFRRGKGQLPQISVHEQVKIDGEVGNLKSDLIHFADPNFKRYLMRADRYTTQTADYFKKHGVKKNSLNTIYYFFIKPIKTFMMIYFRHKGYQDGYRGFVWALFSSAHFFYAYSKYLTDSES